MNLGDTWKLVEIWLMKGLGHSKACSLRGSTERLEDNDCCNSNFFMYCPFFTFDLPLTLLLLLPLNCCSLPLPLSISLYLSLRFSLNFYTHFSALSLVRIINPDKRGKKTPKTTERKQHITRFYLVEFSNLYWCNSAVVLLKLYETHIANE